VYLSEEEMSELENSDMCCVLKDHYGAFVYTNKTMERHFGIPGGFIGKTDYHLMPDTDAAEIRAHDKHVMNTGEEIDTYEIVHQEGEARYFAVWKFRIITGKTRFLGVFGMIFDVPDEDLKKASKLASKRMRDKATTLRPMLEKMATKVAASR